MQVSRFEDDYIRVGAAALEFATAELSQGNRTLEDFPLTAFDPGCSRTAFEGRNT